ncbi:uncharacterized protein LOC130447456 isoform X1 [Diorhabda sublineata]|uniref:uncharacterized protein LOC130447456 isoform X1 n=1 Tax=Diorhabda sublineata TaxID=1163346 RepID=UPI0024E08A38|nr:uncharacterized protein LOC130447456 isoform X1 [Diorhabda sublineata]
MIYFMFFMIVFSFGTCVFGANNSDYPELNPEWTYCLEMTWFGPEYSNVTMYNGTCSDYLDETRAEGIPCAAPIVISYDGTLPNMDYLWDKYRESILCKRSISQRCIKYTYYYNNIIANITYMCAKVQHDSGGIVDSGCYKQKLTEGYETEICVCKSTNGIHWPCNVAYNINALNILILIMLSGLLHSLFS